jgi:putative spermidine/putrescine transport system ATP-binding protein
VHGNGDFIVKVPNGPIRGLLEVGALTQVGWRTEDCRALDA